MKNYLTIAFFLITTISYGQSLNSKWQQDLIQELEQFKNCDTTAVAGLNPCHKYVGNAVKTVYQVNDFYSKEQGRYMVVSEIYDHLKNSKKWTLLGHAYEQNALKEAQSYANAKKAVVAIYLNEDGLGHLSVITPGELKLSGLWGFEVPNSVSFFTSTPENSYVDKSLSYAFGKRLIKNVLIYGRNY